MEGRELLILPNFGEKSLHEVEKRLSELGLRLGMDIAAWPSDRM